MSAALRAELFKQRSTRTAQGLLAAMIVLVVLVVLLHGLGVSTDTLGSSSDQLTHLFGWGALFGALFAALLGATSITGEIRHGTIRPTLLVTPRRGRVMSAKVCSAVLIGSALGLIAGAVTIAVGTAVLGSRGIDIRLDTGDYALLLAGGTASGALWAAIGLGVGAVVRAQTPALVGLAVWLLFVENLLVGDAAGVGDVGRLMPGAAAKASTGQDPDTLLAPAVGLVLLLLYAAAASVAGARATSRRDLA